jgi:DNA polymerase-1
MTLDQLVKGAAIARRGSCPNCELKRETFVPSTMVRGSEIAIVGEAPGVNEVKQRKGFVGIAGQRLRSTLQDVGIDPESCSYLNVVKCFPDGTPDNKTISRCGKRYLNRELLAIEPKLVLLMGASAFSFYFSKRDWGKCRSNFVSSGRFSFLPTWHPSFLNRIQRADPSMYKDVNRQFVRDLDKARRYCEGTLYSDRHYDLVKTEKEAREWGEFLLQQPMLSVDIENWPLHFWEPNPRLITISFSWKEKHAVCFPMDHRDIQDEHFKKVCREVIAKVLASNSVKIWHNRKHDVPWLEWGGFTINGRQIDTMVVAYLGDENLRSYGLKQLSAWHLDGYLDMVDPTHYIPIDRIARYNCEDADNTLRLFPILRKKMTSGLWWVHDNLAVPGSTELLEAERVGIRINLRYLRGLLAELSAELADKVKDANKDMPRGRTIESPDDLRFELFERRKLPVLEYTNKMQLPKVDDRVLKLLDEDYGCKLASKIRDVRKLSKLVNTYLEPFPSYCDHQDRIHCTFLMISTRTGRMSAEKPGMHQIPRDKRIRKIVQCTPGWVFLYGDLATAEMRVAGSLSGDPVLIDLFKRGIDVHTFMGAKMLGIEPEEMDIDKYEEHKEARQNAKPVNFGLLFGQGAPGLMDYARNKYNVRFTLKQCEEIRELYFDMYRGLPPWYTKVIRHLYDYLFVETVFGRQRRIPNLLQMDEGGRGHAERQCINMEVQSPTSDLMLMLVIATQRFLRENGFQMRVILTVHDSLLCDGPAEEVPVVARFIHNFVESWSFPWLKVPMRIDLEKGTAWGATKKLKVGVDF